MDRFKDEKYAKFYKTFLEKIAPKYGDFETKRRELLRHILPDFCIQALVGLIIVTIIVVIDTRNIEEIIDLTKFFGTILSSYILLNCIRHHVVEYKVFLKKEIMPYLLKLFGEINWVNCKETGGRWSYLDMDRELPSNEFSEIQKSGLFLGNYGIPDDKFYGTYKDVKFKIYETVIKIKGNKTDKTEFRGLILLFNFNRKVKAKTIVSSKYSRTLNEGPKVAIGAFCLINIILLMLIWGLSGFPNLFSHGFQHIDAFSLFYFIFISIIFGIVYNPFIYDGKINIGDLSPVVLEDSKFSKRFKVYSKDQVEGRYLVTPAFMERFYNLKTEFGNNKIKCSFYDDKFMVAIESRKDFFEFGNIFKPVHDGLNIYQFYRQIRAIYDMIDYFKLNENIYLK